MGEAFEMWLWRRILRVSWRKHRTNEWVRDQVGVNGDRKLLEEVKGRKLRA